MDQSWMLQARCRSSDTDEFFPTEGTGVEVAKRVCAECPVRSECLDYALEHGIELGIWGGASQRERRRIAKRRRDVARAQKAQKATPGAP